MKKRRDIERRSPMLWEKLTLVLERGDDRTEYSARVENMTRDSLVAGTLIRCSGNSDLMKGDTVEVRYNRDDAVYSFKASIKDLFEGGNESVRMEKVGETRRIQRRRFVRLNVSGEITFRILETGAGDEGKLSRKWTGSLLNISAGGVLFETDCRLQHESLLILDFSLKGSYSLNNILAAVKRVELLDDGKLVAGTEFITRQNRAAYGLETLADFLPPDAGTFDENLEKLVMTFIYDQQIQLRKKGAPAEGTA
jgi:c-di-GMP-binding flagellar brake protein YcgR